MIDMSPQPHYDDSWEPLITGERASAAWSAIDGIASALRYYRDESPDLGGGSAGTAIFFAELARVTRSQRDGDAAIERMDRSIDALADEVRSAGLYAGITGIAWATEYVAARLFDTHDDDDACDEIDDAITRNLCEVPWRGQYDLISGLVGIGVYALARRRRAPSLCDRVVERLLELRRVEASGTTWFTEPALLSSTQRTQAPHGMHNLGLAHGVPGVIAFLGHALACAGHDVAGVLEDSTRWLDGQRLSDASPSAFGWWSGAGATSNPSRAAWCYGDPGIAAALLIAAKALAHPELEQAALRVAHRAAGRPWQSSGAVDAGLCHGTAGLMHIFHRIYRATGDETCRRAACEWFDRTLALRGDGGVAGFTPHLVDEKQDPLPGQATGMLNGAAGIGLALLAAVGNAAPGWDRVLLVDAPCN